MGGFCSDGEVCGWDNAGDAAAAGVYAVGFLRNCMYGGDGGVKWWGLPGLKMSERMQKHITALGRNSHTEIGGNVLSDSGFSRVS